MAVVCKYNNIMMVSRMLWDFYLLTCIIKEAKITDEKQIIGIGTRFYCTVVTIAGATSVVPLRYVFTFYTWVLFY